MQMDDKDLILHTLMHDIKDLALEVEAMTDNIAAVESRVIMLESEIRKINFEEK